MDRQRKYRKDRQEALSPDAGYAALLVFVLIAASPAFAAVPTVSLAPGDLYMVPDEACTVQVVADGAVDSLSCIEIHLSFDPSILALETGLEGELYSTAPFSSFFDWELESPDTALAVDCVLGYRSYIVAPGELVSFVFRAVDEGFTLVSITEVKLWDIDRDELEVNIGPPADVHVSTISGDGGIPGAGATLCNYPNPFNPSTTILIDLPRPSGQIERLCTMEVEIGVFDAAGRAVADLFRGPVGPGRHGFIWDGRCDSGRPAASGIYFATARIEEMVLKRKLVLLR